ncbi:MAG: exo-beta-1,3-glucanase (GH17 family) [Myxococcota bacterium]
MGVLHIQGADLLAGFRPDGTLSFTELSTAELLHRLRRTLEIRLHGLSFSAYVGGQNPEENSTLTEAQVRSRLEIIAPHTTWIRTFSCTQGNEIAPRVAHELGLKTMVGAWIGDDAEKNAAEIAGLIEVARAGHADLLAVGNEVLLRGELSEAALIAQIEAVRAAVPDVPVGYVDAYFLFTERPQLVAACDYLPINCYPFWEEVPLEYASGYAQEMVRRVTLAAQGKPVVIAETGWPTAGSPVGPAEPSLRNMALYLLNVLAWTDDDEIPLFWFSSFDEAWKVGPEGDCGAYWGLWDADGGLKLAQ